MPRTKTVKGCPFFNRYLYDTACCRCGVHGLHLTRDEQMPNRCRLHCNQCGEQTWHELRGDNTYA